MRPLPVTAVVCPQSPHVKRGFAGHSGFTNYVFADGHAKGFKPTATCGAGNTNNQWFNDAVPTPCPSTSSLDLIGNTRLVEAKYP